MYYPWRRAIVRLLAPAGLSTLRLDRNRNKITRAEQARQRALRIGVVGLSAGHTIAHVLAMEGLAGEFRLADFDTRAVEPQPDPGQRPRPRREQGRRRAPDASARSTLTAGDDDHRGDHAREPGAFLDGLDLVIEECDSLDMKFLVREAARERRIPVIMETSDRGVLDVERFDLEPDRPLFHGLVGDMDFETLAGPHARREVRYRPAHARRTRGVDPWRCVASSKSARR